MIQDCDTLDLIWLSAAGETAPAILQHIALCKGSVVILPLPLTDRPTADRKVEMYMPIALI